MGIIYLINAVGTKHYKIGFTAKTSAERLSKLQTSSPHRLELVAERSGTVRTEIRLHEKLQKYWQRGEWFRFPDRETAIGHFTETMDTAEPDPQIQRAAENVMAEVFSRLMHVSVRSAKRNWVRKDSPLFREFILPIAHDKVTLGKTPNYDNIILYLRCPEREFPFGCFWE